jgi:methyl-accepting chemotaxis protein
MNIQNFRIGARLGASFALVLVMLIAIAGLGISRMAKIQTTLVEITKGNNVEASMAAEMQSSVADRRIALRNIVLFTEPAAVQREVDRMQKQVQRYSAAEEKLRAAFATYGIKQEETDLLARLKDDSKAAQPLIDEVTALGQANKTDEAVKMLAGKLRGIQQQWDADLEALGASEKRQSEEATAEADLSYSSARNLMLALSVIALAIGCVLAWFITQGITKPINRAMLIAQTVAAGDLTSDIEVNSKDESGMLLEALKIMNANLRKIVGQVRAGTETMSTASQQIAAGNLDLSSRTEEQASSLEETASSMEELTSTVKQNADNAQQANSQAESASDVAAKGGSVVAQVVSTMEEINQSSKKIVDIISVIDGIAFQTNILALNAAVEAARAGEQGRGFAVVATEVRNLAQRSAAAAKEIKALISDSVEKVENGTKLVENAGTTMGEVVQSVKSVREIINEITEAGREQVFGIEQINQAITQMDSVTQQNAALVEQSAAAAESLQNQAVALAEVVSMFVLGEQIVSRTYPQTALTSAPAPKLVARAAPAVKAKPRALPVAASKEGDWEEF